MPLERKITVTANTQVFVWKITEDFHSLIQGLELQENSKIRLSNMKSVSHQCGFLSIRHLLLAAGYTDRDLYYDENGKPHLSDGKYISITHSFSYSALVISDQNVGIDVEMLRDKILRIADKFTNSEEMLRMQHRAARDKIKELTVVWGAKEAMYKMCNSRSLSFKNHMYVHPFSYDSLEGRCEVSSEVFSLNFRFYFVEMDGFILVYTLV